MPVGETGKDDWRRPEKRAVQTVTDGAGNFEDIYNISM